MILAFSLSDIVRVPFGYLMSLLYQFTTNYGLALILFGILVKLILLPATAKGKRSTMKMSRLSPRLNAIKEKYPDDQTKQSQAIQALYKEEGVSMTGGCLWSFVPLLLMFPLYRVVQQPIVYMLHEGADIAAQIVAVVKEGAGQYFTDNPYYDQMIAAPLIPQFADKLKDIVSNPATLEGINFSFLGIDLAQTPTFNITKWDSYSWANIGAFLLPVLSAGTQMASMFISQKMNNSLVTDERGLEDKETAKNSQANQQGKMMMWTMPLMSLWIGFTFPAALCLYWIVQGVVSTVIDVILTKKYRAIYDAEDAERLQKALAADAAAAEKERIRAEKRAANPDGITENTSKKKLQQAKQREQEAAKREAAKEYAAKKGILIEEEKAAPDALSGDPSRPFCKGRAYDPNRYASGKTEE
ncbi:MAG: membrane protein insertase YidC [Oscillospiraceae bacterium]|nr:membrane protein insertase YidC [Oscillospiraceae bacterium]